MTDNLNETLGRIIANTKRRKRANSIPDIAADMKFAGRQLGGINELSDRIALSPTMIRQFISVEKLDPSVRAMFEDRTLDSVDLCSQLATLGASDQKFLAKALSLGEVGTKDVRDFRELRRRNRGATASELLDMVMSSKEKKVYVAQFILRGGQSFKSVKKEFETALGLEEIIAIEKDGSIVTLTVTSSGRKRLSSLAKKNRVPLDRVFQAIANGNYVV